MSTAPITRLSKVWDRLAEIAALEALEWARESGVELPDRLTFSVVMQDGAVDYSGVEDTRAVEAIK